MTTQRQSVSRAILSLPWLLLVILSLLTPTSLLCKTDRISLKNNYIRTRFGTEQGLYNNLVDDIVQSQDGFLWLRENGSDISRFDGQHFASTTSLGPVQALAVAPNGDLWVGTREELKQIGGSDLGRFGKWPFVTFSFGPHNGVTSLHFTRDGVLWVGTTRGLYRSENGRFTPVLQGPYIQRIDEKADGQLWLMTGDGPLGWDGRGCTAPGKIASELGIELRETFSTFSRILMVSPGSARATGLPAYTGGAWEKA